MAMDQYLLIPFLGEWTSIYQLFWCSPGVQGFDPLPYIYMHAVILDATHEISTLQAGSLKDCRRWFCGVSVGVTCSDHGVMGWVND